MSADLTGKLVVVSSMGTQVGVGIAGGLAAAGAQVILADRATPAAELPEEIGFEVLDGAEPASWTRLGRTLEGRRVDGYVHCGRFDHHVGIDDVQLDDWNNVIAVNLTAVVLGLQTLVPLMPPGSSIVNIGSATAFTAFPSVSDTATAWALRGLTHAADLELADLGIRINALHCGFFAEDLSEAPSDFEAIAIRSTTRGRLAEHRDVASFTAFLLSDDSQFMTSGDIRLDGGATPHAGSRMAKAGMTE
ncbi:SDR family oxidoreductase [Nocardioides immobilis]|uniref:SDR family oxidoreductase n=1 Tax=Nocardioides immobilis TaxID=2049295 RepID=A0A417Y0X8_9ACTN|nr:SDR family oxidoreductase [Nocardioides immobilis]RHW26224.1 SDR family oxidoreductase [Nocardioides immobilis]